MVALYGRYRAGLLGEGEDMAVAEINLEVIVRQKNVLDTDGHYSRPDILRLMLGRFSHRVVEKMASKFVELTETTGENGEKRS
jgi:aliphatic nitrilase